VQGPSGVTYSPDNLSLYGSVNQIMTLKVILSYQH
jgi:hypothetical protein